MIVCVYVSVWCLSPLNLILFSHLNRIGYETLMDKKKIDPGQYFSLTIFLFFKMSFVSFKHFKNVELLSSSAFHVIHPSAGTVKMKKWSDVLTPSRKITGETDANGSDFHFSVCSAESLDKVCVCVCAVTHIKLIFSVDREMHHKCAGERVRERNPGAARLRAGRSCEAPIRLHSALTFCFHLHLHHHHQPCQFFLCGWKCCGRSGGWRASWFSSAARSSCCRSPSAPRWDASLTSLTHQFTERWPVHWAL